MLQIHHKYPLGLVYSSIICVSCIVLILLKQNSAMQSTIAQSSSVTSWSKRQASLSNINTRDIQQIWDWWRASDIETGIEKVVQNISYQSEQQRHTMQIQNTNSNFHPETLIWKYFKTFSGDVATMQK